MSHSRAFLSAILFGLVGLATACSGAASVTTSQVSGLDTSYPNALNNRTQLLLGTVRLEEGTGPALTKEQATKLIPLWQASKSLAASGTASQAEVDAVIAQILAAMTPEQIKAINAMHLTQTDMQAFNQTLGVVPPSGLGAGGVPGGIPGQGPIPGGVPGQGQSLSPAERATRQAEFGGTGNSTASVDHLIGVLQKKAGQ